MDQQTALQQPTVVRAAAQHACAYCQQLHAHHQCVHEDTCVPEHFDYSMQHT